MGGRTSSLPPPRVIAAALRQTTETLARELAASSLQPPDWNPFEWCIARVAATIHGIAPLLATGLRWSGPGDWDQFLAQQRLHVATRQQRIDRLLEQIDAAARDGGYAVVALKGAALHRLGLCQPGERPMGDIDLLVSPQHSEQASRLILSLGYLLTDTTWRHRIFEPEQQIHHNVFGEQPDGMIKIELHTRVAERLPASEIDITAGLVPAGAGAGLHNYATLDALMLHQLLHAAGNMSSRWLRLLQLNDIATIARHMTEANWHRLTGQGQSQQHRWWMFPPLELAVRYLNAPVPPTVMAPLRQECHFWLRHSCARRELTDVSSSSLWVRAVPAMAWAGSATELCRYFMRRLHPLPAEMAQMGSYASKQSWSAEGSWYSQSQLRRMVQWLVSRPARPQIMQAVRLAQLGS